MKNNVVNLVNFIRGCEPRNKDLDLYTPIAGEIKLNKKYNLKSTFLVQYDAMLRKDFINLLKKEDDDNTEYGVWIEIVRPLTEKCGIEWRGREGFDWDWYVNPGFLLAYTQEQRRNLIDEIFRLYKEIFGEYPRVVGSWLIDAYSMEYMSENYEIDAFAICREQYAVDAYTLWGGYYNGGYYPSKNNMICPAQNEKTQINTPVFRMLGIDPIYAYDEKKHSAVLDGCYTMEPCWPCGSDEKVMDWYFKSYFTNPSLSQSHATTGQENSFGWNKIGEGYELQAKLLKKYIADGNVVVETLGETGRAFKKKFKNTPASALSALEDWSDNGIQSVWYSCQNYRANLFYKSGQVYFRDFHVFDDTVTEEYLAKPCTEWQATYETLPVVENRLWSDETTESILSFCDCALGIEKLNENDNALEVSVKFTDGHIGIVKFSEKEIAFTDCGDFTLSFGKGDILQSIENGTFNFIYRGTEYSLHFDAKITQNEQNIKISSADGKIVCRVTE